MWRSAASLLAPVVLATLVLAPSPARAQPGALARCTNINSPFDALPACNAVIADKAASPADLLTARVARGNVNGALRQYQKAILDYSEALKSKPDLPIALVNRGICYEALHQDAKALEDFDRSVRLAPDLPQAYAARGGYWGRKNDPARALPDLDQAVKLRPDDAPTRLNRGAALADLGDHAKALADFDDAIRRQPSALAYYDRCTSRAILGQLPEALADCNQALFLRSNYPEVLASRGLVYLRMKEPARAIADYDLVLRLTPRHAQALYGRGLAKLLLNDTPGGQTDLAAARKIEPAIEAVFKRWGVPGA